jgi:TM2 domain-containing membrane protein YozV
MKYSQFCVLLGSQFLIMFLITGSGWFLALSACLAVSSALYWSIKD